jgi:uncharacterized NAD-dependent epimerase/dehydratase family protein
MPIERPYLLFLGDVPDPLAAKTAYGVVDWRRDWCVGQMRLPGCKADTGLKDMTFAEAKAAGARTFVVGAVNAGGVLPERWVATIVEAINSGMDVASGLHDRLSAFPAVRAAAEKRGAQLHDVRHADRTFATGKGTRRPGKRILTVGTDCSVGKKYAALALEAEMTRRGFDAEFCATGQTGVLIAGRGIAIDAVVADFISGATEAISPARDDGGWDLIEGQGSLYHPSYAGVSLGLLHGAQPDAIVLCHEVGRPHIRGIPGRPLPGLGACLEANLTAARLTNPEVIAVGVSLNTSRLGPDEARRACEEAERMLGLPCQDPMAGGVARIVERLLECFEPFAVA